MKCVAIQITSTNMHTSTLERSTSMSTSTRQSTSTDISAAINAEIISWKFCLYLEEETLAFDPWANS